MIICSSSWQLFCYLLRRPQSSRTRHRSVDTPLHNTLDCNPGLIHLNDHSYNVEVRQDCDQEWVRIVHVQEDIDWCRANCWWYLQSQVAAKNTYDQSFDRDWPLLYSEIDPPLYSEIDPSSTARLTSTLQRDWPLFYNSSLQRWSMACKTYSWFRYLLWITKS